MARYIDANKIRYSWTYDEDGTEHDGITLESIVDKVPTADVSEVDHGKWEWYRELEYTCSRCNSTTEVDEVMGRPLYNFCPYCGAKMDGETK